MCICVCVCILRLNHTNVLLFNNTYRWVFARC